MAGKINLIGKTLEEIKNELENEGLAAYRATQIYQWIYKRQTSDFSRMTNLGLKLREQLAEKYDVSPLKTIKNRKSGDNSEKFLFELKDKEKIETVFLPVTGKRNSICLSTQVGCRFNCGFCATGKQGFTRNLSCGEIINQLLTVQLEKDVKITNVVFMGMGEPLDNYDNLVKTIALLNDGRGLNISCRRMTVSTCGLANKIKKLANSGFPVTLAISLHSGFNSLRDELVPVNKHYPIADLLEAADYYSEKTGRRVSYEYALIKGVNDSKNQARKLADL
ncbi:MAG: 23S rRNA (adenine(2503)-C(2))-methyltransferase RlmN, partial [bacterium]